MADGHDLLTSPKYKKLSFESININSINLLKDQADLVYDGKRVIWSRDFFSLQNFVKNVIGLSGTWRSSGGKSKQFTASNLSFIMTWYPGKLNSLTFNGRDGESFKTWLLNVLISKRVKRTDTDGGCLHALAETSVKSKQHLASVSQIVQDLTMLEVSKVSTGGHSDEAIDEVLSADCSTLDELEDFIDRSFQNVNILTQNNNANIFPVRSTDSSTPSRTQDEAELGITVKHFRMFKNKIESDIAVLINNLSEQTQIINKSKQDICELSDENLNLKSRLTELEVKVLSGDLSNNTIGFKKSIDDAVINEVNLPSSSATSIPLDSISKIATPNEVYHAQIFLESEPTPILRPANQVDVASQVCLDTIGDNLNSLSNCACRCSCGVLAADAGGVNLDMTISSNRIGAIAGANTEHSHKDMEIDRLRIELSIERARSEKLESDLNLLVKERSLEIEKLNLTIASLENKNASTSAAPVNNNSSKINKKTLMNENNRNSHRNNGHYNNNGLNQCKSQNVSSQPFISAPVNNREFDRVPLHDTDANIDNVKTKETNQLCDQVGQLKQNIPSSQGSKPNNYQYNQHIPTRITYRKQQLYPRRRSHAKRNDLNNQNDLIRHNDQNNGWKSNDDASRSRERRQLEEGFRTETRWRDKMKFYQFFY